MLYALIGSGVVGVLFFWAVVPVLWKDKRRWDRRTGRLFAPIERRRKSRRRRRAFADLRWALRCRFDQLRKRPPKLADGPR